MQLLPYFVLGAGVLSFVFWWLAYLKQAANPNGKPPNMWLVSTVHVVFVLFGFLVPFFLDFDEQRFMFLLVSVVSLFLLFLSLVVGLVRMVKN